jgi:hypothetical protein
MHACIPFKPEEMIRGVPSHHLVDIQEVKETKKINCLANYMPVQPYLWICTLTRVFVKAGRKKVRGLCTRVGSFTQGLRKV